MWKFNQSALYLRALLPLAISLFMLSQGEPQNLCHTLY